MAQPAQPPEQPDVVKEGRASVLQPKDNVFYNKAQVINRDLSVAVLRYFAGLYEADRGSGRLRKALAKAARAQGLGRPPKLDEAPTGLRILEGLSASGLRSLRYALEVEAAREVVANDVDEGSVAAIRRNVALNGPLAQQKVAPSCEDARLLMLRSPGAFDVVDLDPYGSPCMFLDSAVQAVAEGGLLMVTATDMAVLCGNNGEACYAKYGAFPLHRPYCHEMAIRILLACLETHAIRHKRVIEPVLSLSIDFYLRVFVRLWTSPNDVREAATRQAYVWQSQGCDAFQLQPVARQVMKGNNPKYAPSQGPAVPQRCPETGAAYLMGGPIWAGPLHSPEALAAINTALEAETEAAFASLPKLRGLLRTAAEELPDAPLYYDLHALARSCHTTPPRMDAVRSALVHAGHRVSSSHACPLGIKTDAPSGAVIDIMRCWGKDHPGRAAEPGSYGEKLLAKQPQLQANFSKADGAGSAAKAAKLARFLPNPEPNWGPKKRHRPEGAKEGAEAAAQPMEAEGPEGVPPVSTGAAAADDTGQAEQAAAGEQPPKE